jgi:Plasmid replication region DNA-binding N-term
MPDVLSTGYGASRERGANVSHAEIERAALDLLAAGRRPSVALIRSQIKRGSPATIASSLKRFWRDLGTRAEGDPAALARLPSEIADMADGMWQRALALAGQAAKHDDNAARERLAQIKLENELRAQSFSLREKELETAARERERALSDARQHLATMMKMMESDRALLRARDIRISDLEARVEDYRQQLATLVTRASSRNRAATKFSAKAVAASKKTSAAKRSRTGFNAKRKAARKRRFGR